MKNETDSYLLTVATHLDKLTVTEKNDILEEISGHIEDSLNAGVSEAEILKNLGDPASLARSFVGTNLLKNPTFNLKQILKIITFYAKTGFSGMVIVPFLSIMSFALYIFALFAVIAGAIITVAAFFGVQLPFVLNLGFWSAPPIAAFPITAVFGLSFYLLSKYLWRTLKKYLVQISKQHQKIAQG
ncbi:hypothetical protein ATZ33_18100 [Enterococcus silesiacus]|uniref:DUF1700 domain-containing protein n=1 Tax=Enterococcus silesiacus TaxID=332949 RepID=A0A0S3KG08_9ENTE|nr:DUF1700 domain-containing protein [Enterococcus silesiacus]ALS03216.1 hypothetical protein ATZ33_18100 [Enterococcus silesiacus]OJG89369.1 hypothetical protein RV15_GL001676 [Enterococcus silesiacus]